MKGREPKTYARKRDFAKTPEPPPDGGTSRESGGVTADTPHIFVIQKHAASRLHWDLRLERNGALASWAVPKEPPLEEGTKRLAVKVEDHPLSYASFEGVIPEGNYGAGSVEIWDRGTYTAEKYGPREILAEFTGGKVSGRYALINTGGKNWLFFKRKRTNERT